RTDIQTGVSDGEWIEVTNRRLKAPADTKAPQELPTAFGDDDIWVPFDGSEQVIVGDLATLTEGTPVEASPATGQPEVASVGPQAAPQL
ncbi:MAG TPA: hypothetical protein VGX76_21220, partial [Pirellulales bacterium]|nr:hypothetical protein [Pirellulales bacterium]